LTLENEAPLYLLAVKEGKLTRTGAFSILVFKPSSFGGGQARLGSGNAIGQIRLRWSADGNGDAVVSVVEDFKPLRDAIEKLPADEAKARWTRKRSRAPTSCPRSVKLSRCRSRRIAARTATSFHWHKQTSIPVAAPMFLQWRIRSRPPAVVAIARKRRLHRISCMATRGASALPSPRAQRACLFA
jgi:hypothetical protein